MRRVYFIMALLFLVPLLLLLVPQVRGEGAPAAASGVSGGTESPANRSASASFGFLAASLAVGLGSIGAGIAVAAASSAAIGAVAEKEEVAGKALVFVGLAEGIAIYGLVIAIMILNKL